FPSTTLYRSWAALPTNVGEVRTSATGPAERSSPLSMAPPSLAAVLEVKAEVPTDAVPEPLPEALSAWSMAPPLAPAELEVKVNPAVVRFPVPASALSTAPPSLLAELEVK